MEKLITSLSEITTPGQLFLIVNPLTKKDQLIGFCGIVEDNYEFTDMSWDINSDEAVKSSNMRLIDESHPKWNKKLHDESIKSGGFLESFSKFLDDDASDDIFDMLKGFKDFFDV